jgi:transcriptional regulator with XRE-family HTH domain
MAEFSFRGLAPDPPAGSIYQCIIHDGSSESVEVASKNFETFEVGKPQREIDPYRDELAALRSALGNRIRQLRKAKGWSQEQFAAYAHVHRTFAGALERGEKNLSFHALVLISRCFGISLAELLADLETGGSPRPSRGPEAKAGLDRRRILRELAAAEGSIKTAIEIASQSKNESAPEIERRRVKSRP